MQQRSKRTRPTTKFTYSNPQSNHQIDLKRDVDDDAFKRNDRFFCLVRSYFVTANMDVGSINCDKIHGKTGLLMEEYLCVRPQKTIDRDTSSYCHILTLE